MGVEAELFTDDATTMKRVNGHFNLALDMGCFHGVTGKADYLTQLTRILSPAGSWLMYGFFKSAPHLSGPGLVAADIDMIQAHSLRLISRRDGFDRHDRPSAWFLFQKI